MAVQRTFSYKARDQSGDLITGSVVATTADEVSARLRGEGKYVLSVSDRALTETVELDSDAIIRNESARRVRRDDVIAFCNQIGVMMETGVSLTDAMDSFRAQVKSEHFRRVLDSVYSDVSAGAPLSTALSKWPRVFPIVMVSLMKASEASGSMASMIALVGTYLSKERRTAKQIKGALTYPIFMLSIGIAITVFLVSVVLPRFASIYEQRAASLPWPTKFLIDVSDFLTTHFMVYGPISVAVIIAFLAWRKQESGRKVLDWLRLHVPVIRTLFGQLYLTRATRTMSTLLAAGVSLLDIIDICRGVTQNYYWSKLWDRMNEQVRNGQQLSDAVDESGIIPPNVVSMIAAGEKSGRLSEVMNRIAEFADEELDTAVKQTTTFIEPVMICLMGIVVGGVAIALLMPIFTIGNVMSGQ